MTTTPLPPFSEQQLKDALSVAFPFDTEQDGSWSLLESERRISEAVIAARDAQWQAYAQQARADLEAENARLKKIAWLIGSIFVHGNFKAETYNERELETLLRENGTFWESLADFDASAALESKP